ncbi:MAG: tripartite tricarboxylate transporter substrate binding protein [Pusillimonas sp.]
MKGMIRGAALALLMCSASVGIAAESYPTKPVRLVVPSAPGGSTDQLARLLGDRLGAAWGQTVVIENKPGAGLTLGAAYVADAPADGYTLLMGAVHHTIAQSFYENLFYDIERDLAPVSIVAIVPNVMITRSEFPADSTEDVIAYSKAHAGELTYGSTGAGTAHHLIGEQFNTMAGTDLLHVPYKGSSPALVDLMGGRIDFMFDTVASCLPHIKSGKLKPIAVATNTRSSALPEVPTLDESGLPGFDIATWFGLMAPAGTPQPIIDKIHAETTRILADPAIKERLLAMGAEPVGSSPDEMGKRINAEVCKFGELIAKANITAKAD